MADAIICRRSGGGGSIPSSMLEKVTAPALENITMGQAVEYRMYPGEDVFAHSLHGLDSATLFGASRDLEILLTRPDTQHITVWRLIDGVYTIVQSLYSGANLYYQSAAVTDDHSCIFITRDDDTNGYTLMYKHNGTSYVATGASVYTSDDISSKLLVTVGDGYLITMGYTSPYFKAFKIDKNAGTLTACVVTGLPSNVPASLYSLSCDNAATYVCAGLLIGTSSFCHIFKRTGDVFSLISSTSANSTNVGRTAISPTGKYVATGFGATLTVSKIVGDTLVPVEINSTERPSSYPYTIVFSPDEKYVYCGVIASPYVWICKINSEVDTFTKLANPSTLPVARAEDIFTSQNGQQVLLKVYQQTAYPIYTTGAGTYILPLRNLRDARYFALNQYANYKLGVADATVTAGQPCTATMFKVLNEVIT